MCGSLRFHHRKLMVFILLSVADLVLTWHLVQQGGGQIYESNPVANAWLATYGWVGLIIFKAAMVLLIAALAVYISFYRPRTTERILTFGCLVTAGVVGYSCYLSRQMTATEHEWTPEEIAQTHSDGGACLRQLAAQHDQEERALRQLTDQLVGGHLDLKGAVERFERSVSVQTPGWMRVLELNYPHRSRQEYLAIQLVHRTLASLGEQDAATAKALTGKLEIDYQKQFGSPLPSIDLARRSLKSGAFRSARG